MFEYVWRRVYPQRLVMGFCAVVVLAAALGVGLQPGVQPGPVATGPTPRPTIQPPRAPATVAPSPSAAPLDPRAIALRNATIDIPVWPGGQTMSTACPAGPRTFADGAATAGLPDGRVQNSYHLSVLTYAELDTPPGEDYLVALSCDNENSFHPEMLLGVKPGPDGTMRVLGTVITTQSGELYDFNPNSLQVQDRTVRVEVYGPHRSNGAPAFQQQRAYRFDGEAFHQVDGPRTSPADDKNIRDVDPRNAEFYVAGQGHDSCEVHCNFEGPVRFVGGVGTALTNGPQADTPQQITLTINQVSYGRLGARGLAYFTVTVRGPAGQTRHAVLVAAYRDESGGLQLVATSVLEVGDEGVIDILTQQGGDQVKVTVKTASGQEIRSYRSDAGDLWTWRRTS